MRRKLFDRLYIQTKFHVNECAPRCIEYALELYEILGDCTDEYVGQITVNASSVRSVQRSTLYRYLLDLFDARTIKNDDNFDPVACRMADLFDRILNDHLSPAEFADHCAFRNTPILSAGPDSHEIAPPKHNFVYTDNIYGDVTPLIDTNSDDFLVALKIIRNMVRMIEVANKHNFITCSNITWQVLSNILVYDYALYRVVFVHYGIEPVFIRELSKLIKKIEEYCYAYSVQTPIAYTM